MPEKRFRFTVEIDEHMYNILSSLPHGMRKEVYIGLFKTFISSAPKLIEGKLDLIYAFAIAQSKFKLIKKEDEGEH